MGCFPPFPALWAESCGGGRWIVGQTGSTGSTGSAAGIAVLPPIGVPQKGEEDKNKGENKRGKRGKPKGEKKGEPKGKPKGRGGVCPRVPRGSVGSVRQLWGKERGYGVPAWEMGYGVHMSLCTYSGPMVSPCP